MEKSFKNQLQEWCHSMKNQLPVYKYVNCERYPKYACMLVLKITSNGVEWKVGGFENTKKQASENAARDAMTLITHFCNSEGTNVVEKLVEFAPKVNDYFTTTFSKFFDEKFLSLDKITENVERAEKKVFLDIENIPNIKHLFNNNNVSIEAFISTFSQFYPNREELRKYVHLNIINSGKDAADVMLVYGACKFLQAHPNYKGQILIATKDHYGSVLETLLKHDYPHVRIRLVTDIQDV